MAEPSVRANPNTINPISGVRVGHPRRAPVWVSVVSSIGYCAFPAGPPLIGLLAGSTGILRALFVVLGALVPGLLCPRAARPLIVAEPSATR